MGTEQKVVVIAGASQGFGLDSCRCRGVIAAPRCRRGDYAVPHPCLHGASITHIAAARDGVNHADAVADPVGVPRTSPLQGMPRSRRSRPVLGERLRD